MTVPDVDVQRSHSRFSSTFWAAAGLGSLAWGAKGLGSVVLEAPAASWQQAGSEPAAIWRRSASEAASGQGRLRRNAGRASRPTRRTQRWFRPPTGGPGRRYRRSRSPRPSNHGQLRASPSSATGPGKPSVPQGAASEASTFPPPYRKTTRGNRMTTRVRARTAPTTGTRGEGCSQL